MIGILPAVARLAQIAYRVLGVARVVEVNAVGGAGAVVNALVTGGAGFIGSHLVDALLERGVVVDVIDDLSRGRRENMNDAAHYDFCRIQDVGDGGWCDDYDAVFHLAALARVQPSIEDPIGYALANEVGTVAALEIARRCKAHFVLASSSSVYGDGQLPPFVEGGAVEPKSPYALTKLVGEAWCKLYGELHGVSCTALRFFNVYGERQIPGGPYSTVIGIFDKQLADGEPLTIVGDGTQTRAYCYVKDTVAAILLAADKRLAGTYNVSGAREVSVNELAEAVAGPDYERARIERQAEPARTFGDTSGLEEAGWRPTTDVIDWIKARA